MWRRRIPSSRRDAPPPHRPRVDVESWPRGNAVKNRILCGALPLVALCLSLFAAPGWGTTLGDIFYSRDAGPADQPPAYFPHWVHRIKYKCYACHDALFPMQRGANPTMAAMEKGASCGACHNGKTAFAVDTCQRCHVSQ
ncbi:MAG: cytochrome c3 family protein [Deltaproteobacteria bacterium]|nr:cytochrome c3 family protein [Deltaproteobacteria bacterium]